MSIKVYPKLIIYCPKNSKEQDDNECKKCPYFKTFIIVENEIYIDCSYDL